MKRNELFRNIFSLFLISCIYFGVFLFLYALLHSAAIATISIVFVSYVSWKRGTVAGLVLSGFNFAWNMIALGILAHINFSIEASLSIVLHIGVSLLLGYFGKIARDLHKEIETRKKAESLLKVYQTELEKLVEARTSELEKAKEKLFQAEKMEAIGQLGGGVAHDFNNYLNIIIACSSMLIAKLDATAKVQEYAERIEQAAKMASELTSQLLTFARKKKFELLPTDIAGLVNRLIPLLSRGVKKDITINHSTEQDLPMIQGDASQLQNTFINLGLNANDAMEAGGVLTFTTKTIAVTEDYCRQKGISCTPGTYVSVAVSDTGGGIAPEAMTHLFEPFFTTKPEGKGTGLGLAAAYGIAEGHHGFIFAETQVGKGTTVTMLFPALVKN